MKFYCFKREETSTKSSLESKGSFETSEEEEKEKTIKVVKEVEKTSTEKKSDETEKVVVKKEVVHHTTCNCVHVPELTRSELEERIRRIREELNLPQTSVKEELHHHCHHGGHQHKSLRQTHVHCLDDSNLTKWVSTTSVDDSRFRSRSKSAAERWYRSKSKSKSPGRVTSAKPAWIPTGSNDYTSTYLRRADMIINSEKKKADVRPSTSLGTTSSVCLNQFMFKNTNNNSQNTFIDSFPWPINDLIIKIK